MIELSIRAFPTFRFYLDGKQVDETRGANIQEVARKVRLCFVCTLDEKLDASFRFDSIFLRFDSILLRFVSILLRFVLFTLLRVCVAEMKCRS